jgi:diaminopimelate epimerase
MSGAGNDFIVLDGEQFAVVEAGFASWVRRICTRGLSVGADGVLVVEPSGPGRVRVRFFNPDGSAAFCGNGSRCAARFAAARGMVDGPMVLETDAGEVPARIDGEHVVLTLPCPVDAGERVVDWDEGRLRGRLVQAGVPHFVVKDEETGGAPLEHWGPAVRKHTLFGARGVNADLLTPLDDARLALRTWERGVEAETLACGSGAVAAAFTARLTSGGRRFQVIPASGVPLQVSFPDEPAGPAPALLEGDARFVFECEPCDEAVQGFPELADGRYS